MTGRLPALLAELGGRLPPDRLSDWQRLLQAAKGPTDPVLDQWTAASPAAGLAQQWGAIRQAWREEAPGLPGSGIALALAAVTAAAGPDVQPVELVVSGPASPAVPIRLTSGIAVEVIRSAEESLLIASFAAYGIAQIVRELREAQRRGVRIDLLLEESTAAVKAFAPLLGDVRIWHRSDGPGAGALHAKLIAADRHTALLGSANLTDRALHENIEIGVVLRDPPTVSRLVDHFRWLIGKDGSLRPV
ncbi:DISARM system phospholipase D-like protein DrmC [Streptomyces sp. ISL-99]|uniref:DISARM system phospholipase D-like protein DrmC n=1 Tax=Streptomyces sp. ISL-99 TaxID=2819193 RepID=UPI001BECD789|nr:DISARM system phospholipase D-like protein DrmC [Streptomyces sp. ISL-99]MBT2524548.1 DISARM system phospholipase D-like protein DrmC [Streptomyces sp. ISL-99]